MSQEKKSKIIINGEPVEVNKRRLTFYNIQSVAPLMMHGTLDFSEYWRYAFANWLSYSDLEGHAIDIDINNISPDDGAKLTSLLPEPSQVMDWLVFREAKLVTSDTSSMGDQ
jgi:hypothetical protein